MTTRRSRSPTTLGRSPPTTCTSPRWPGTPRGRARTTCAAWPAQTGADAGSSAAKRDRKSRTPAQHGYFEPPGGDRTAYLLLTIYPRDDAVAICADAGQVRGGALCCRPTYLVI